jgi:hypothetical protein
MYNDLDGGFNMMLYMVFKNADVSVSSYTTEKKNYKINLA